ncbi:MAG TPA: alkaline phosphatase family protein [Roseiflexaceae bacterium]|nr:alkaline phosphatase family protein [Roseiflexaceae bacterium]
MQHLFIVIDGIGYDQIERFQPSGLIERGKRTGLVPLTTLLTYSSGIYPSIWSGQYPDQHLVWTEFFRRPAPRRAVTGPLGLLPGKYLLRKAAYVALAVLKRLGMEQPEYAAIPPQVQSCFDRVQSQYWNLPPVPMPAVPLISQKIERSGQTWEYVFCEALDQRAERRIHDTAARVDTLLVCFPDMDKAGHELGPMSAAFGEAFHAFDARLARLIAELEQRWPDTVTFLCSDHGMTTVTRQFDAWSYLEQRGFRLGHEYLAFINSTIISLWFDNGHRDEISHALNQSGYGRVLSPDEHASYHLDFPDRRYGDRFFVADEGVELIPNFISLANQANYGMHGYDPACSSTRAFFIGGKQVDVQPSDVVDLYDVLTEAAVMADCLV